MSQDYTPAQAIALQRDRMAEHPCPWCNAVAWNAGALVATVQMDRLTDATVTASLPVPLFQFYVFTCTTCGYAATFSAGSGDMMIRTVG